MLLQKLGFFSTLVVVICKNTTSKSNCVVLILRELPTRLQFRSTELRGLRRLGPVETFITWVQIYRH